MDSPGRAVHPLLVVALIAVAIVGYLAGHRHTATPASAEKPHGLSRSLSSSGLLLEYPVAWERATANTSIPGLTLAHPVTLRPRGSSAAGLLMGQLPSAEPGPLPASFLALLHGLPHVEVVDLVSTQAYRYSRAAIPGYSGALDLYVIPAAGQAARVIACYASERLTPASQQCEQIVAGVALTGPPTPTLTPEPTYAQQLSAVVTSLDAERARARRQMSKGGSAGLVAKGASTLATHLSSAAASLAALEPPALLAPAATELATALRHAGSAYSALSAAASEESVAAYDAARTSVASAEAQIDSALGHIALLGYSTA